MGGLQAMRSRLQLDWRAPSTFFLSDPDWKKKLFIGGAWILACPPLGWPMALGYRKAVILRLHAGQQPVLPEWRGHQWHYLADGLRAIGVMLFYFAPFFALLWSLAVPDLATLSRHGTDVALFFAGVLLLVPICLPGLPLLYVSRFDWFSLSPGRALLLSIVFIGTTFVIPAGYMQISRTGRFLSALNLLEVVRLLRHHFRLYVEAWLQSLALTAVGLSLLVLAPWGIFWSYLGIVYCFNEIFAKSHLEQYQRVAAHSWFVREQSPARSTSGTWGAGSLQAPVLAMFDRSE